MCEYLVGLIRSAQVSSESTRRAMREEASRSGYGLQFNGEIPASMRNEILSLFPGKSPALLFNVTSELRHDCIEETLSRELAYYTKANPGAVSFFQFLRRLFGLARPEEAYIVYVEGAEVGWTPLERRKMSLERFLELLYEYRDRIDYDVAGIYEISA